MSADLTRSIFCVIIFDSDRMKSKLSENIFEKIKEYKDLDRT